jgi:hypothetical protein
MASDWDAVAKPRPIRDKMENNVTGFLRLIQRNHPQIITAGKARKAVVAKSDRIVETMVLPFLASLLQQ